jgi:MscS family membrane protein
MDKAVQVGNLCRIGDHVGQVEDVGLRSVKIRTREQSLLVVPNGVLARMQFENFASRRKCLINQHFALRIETSNSCGSSWTASRRHCRTTPKSNRERRECGWSGLPALRMNWNCGHTPTAATGQKFTAMQQDVILNVAEIVAASGTQFAAPTTLTYLSRDTVIDREIDKEKVNSKVERHVSADSDVPI